MDPDEPVSRRPSESPPTNTYSAAIVLDKLKELTLFWEEVETKSKAADGNPSAGYYV